MALDASKIKIAGSGAIWKAPAGTTLPTDSTSALNAAFVNLGYVSEGGFTLANDLKTKEINAWQTIEVVRLINTAMSRSISFEALESNNKTVALAWGGATITAGSAGAYTIDIPDPSLTQEFILVVDWNDGSTSQRIIIKRAALKNLPKVKFTRQDAISYSLEISALVPTDNSDPIVAYGVDTGVAA
jgi:hypothetical protein